VVGGRKRERIVAQKPTSSIGTTIRELAETVIFIVLVFAIFRGVVQNFRIDGSSMEPSFHDREFIWVNKLEYFHFDANAPLRLLPGNQDLPKRMVYPMDTPQRGDVVVLEPPTLGGVEDKDDYIKRVIGLPGETIQIKDGRVLINGQPLPESKAEGAYLVDTTDCYGGKLCEPYTIPEGHVVVLGDHRTNSTDSRSWAGDPALPIDRIVGKAWLIYWPRTEWGFVATPTYAQPAP
jgi:signal peptidase I